MGESGQFYGLVVDPILNSVRRQIRSQIVEGESVIDIACGTGAQAFQIAAKASRVLGIDLSESMIRYARRKLKKQNTYNLEFVVANATNLIEYRDDEFDVATMSLALHQFPPELYSPVLSEMKRVAKRIVIVDYTVPLKNNLAGVASKTIEFLAGKEHNRCFKQYYKAGGLHTILNKNGLKIKSCSEFGGGALSLLNCISD